MQAVFLGSLKSLINLNDKGFATRPADARNDLSVSDKSLTDRLFQAA
ncbi:MAG: hypothetical protein IKH45_03070 [Neisseriaceae bacterium]|nr:hypothetical protein [Neisseriaceae bacterium]MBR3481853.1 hypothetical protein [Neisseriaceae bacterium]